MDEVMIPVSEIFYSVQGEGPFIGQPAVFLRVEGCGCQCEFCFGVVEGKRIPRIVLSREKNKEITDVQVGDKLMTFNNEGRPVETTVVNVLSRYVNEWIRLTVDGTSYYVTPEHPIFTKRGLVKAGDLRVGDSIFRSDSKQKIAFQNQFNPIKCPGVATVKKVKRVKRSNYPPSTRPEPLKVYNLTCAPYNTYLIDYMWVHNCDSKYTWKPKHFRSISDVSKEITSLLQQHNCNRVVITGGEPLLYCNELVKLCFRYLQHCKFEIETSGTQFPLSLLSDKIWYNVSPKPPSAHSKCEYSPQILKFFNSVKNSTFKFVVRDESDFEWVLSVVSKCSINTSKVMVMPEGTTAEEILPRLKWLAPLSLKYGFGVTPRLQILVWGNRRGV